MPLRAPPPTPTAAVSARCSSHIDAHPETDLSLERLSSVAAFSKYHFLRQFSELLGIGVHKYVQLVRMKRAGYALAFRGRPHPRHRAGERLREPRGLLARLQEGGRPDAVRVSASGPIGAPGMTPINV